MQFPLLIQIPYLATRSFLFPLTLAPLHDNHRFKTETVQCSAGFGNLAPVISSSLSSIASPFLSTNRGDMAAISNQRASPKTAPAFHASQTSFKDYFEFQNGQLQEGDSGLRLAVNIKRNKKTIQKKQKMKKT